MSRLSLCLVLLVAATARAQTVSTTSGAIRGTITDKKTGGPVILATVTATSPQLQGLQSAFTDEEGNYFLDNLPPGPYALAVQYAAASVTRQNIVVALGKVAEINVAIDSAGGETITVIERAPVIDQGSTKTGVTITPDLARNVPVRRTFVDALLAAGGTQTDQPLNNPGGGVSFSGSTSPENIYIIDGLNTTDMGYGRVATSLPHEFIAETEVISGGYGAELGRSTGGIVNVITKTGSNEFHGSVFTYFSPGALASTDRPLPRAGSAISYQRSLDFRVDMGAELGGPIIEDELWFHVGIDPSFSSLNIDRVISTQVDEDGDGLADVDDNGFAVTEPLGSRTIKRPASNVFYTGKLTYAVDPDHQGSLSAFGNPGVLEGFNDEQTGVSGADAAMIFREEVGALDFTARWMSRFDDGRSQIDALVGWHQGRDIYQPKLAQGSTSTFRYLYERPITDFAEAEPDIPAACVDGVAGDPYPRIVNCPVNTYNVGGMGQFREEDSRRLAAKLTFTQRVRGLGYHVLKAGLDVEAQRFDVFRGFTGGAFYLDFGGAVLRQRFLTLGAGPLDCGNDLDVNGVPDFKCDVAMNGISATTHDLNWAVFLQESWEIVPNLTLNAGLRFEQQAVGAADELQGLTSGSTGRPIPRNALVLNMIAPRVGFIYDWTREGKSRVFGHFGRYFESIPMDLNTRQFGGEIFNVAVVGEEGCSPEGVDTRGLTCDESEPFFAGNVGGGTTLTAPGIGAQYIDEVVAGVEYEVLADTKVGLTYVYRGLGRAIEDISPDQGATLVLANPGEIDADDVAALRAQAARASDPVEKAWLLRQADLFEGIAGFDRPKRTYHGVVLSASRRFSRKFMLMGSYTFSSLRGNFPGLFSPETGQLDPNGTSMYDLPDLMANRYGPLAHDRPHIFKLDGYYQTPIAADGRVTLGGSFRAASGRPTTYLGSHVSYGTGEAYILPRGAGERTSFATSFDAHVAYAHQLSKTMTLEGFVDVFNLIDSQPAARTDEIYTYDTVNPIVGGDARDLEHLKNTSGQLVTVNRNFGNATAVSPPREVRLGLRLTF